MTRMTRTGALEILDAPVRVIRVIGGSKSLLELVRPRFTLIIGKVVGGGSMKANIHPNYVEAVVKCACGETFRTRSTKPEIHLEICSKCHPFFTGKQKLVDTAGRVERFQRKYKKTS